MSFQNSIYNENVKHSQKAINKFKKQKLYCGTLVLAEL